MNAPIDSNMAYVVIQHLSPDYKSLMADLRSKRTEMPVHVAEDGMPVEPNCVYLIPPKQSITIFHRKLFLTERASGLLYLPIDIFFQSLAEDVGEKAIGVILSGTGSDGARGLRAIKEKGRLAIVQDERSAKFDGIPRSAIATNLVDYVLLPEQMAREIINYVQHPRLSDEPASKRVILQDEDSLNKIFALLRSSSGVDFTFYKQSTMIRRIERRMGIKQINSLADYLRLLYQTPTELNTLYREFLIGLTHFFRDKEAFEILKKEIIPAIFANKKRGESIRVWVPGCSTGEEAYSIAILLNEYMETTGRHIDVKVFATDLDKNALDFAVKGVYPESIVEDVSAEHLQNYFIKNVEFIQAQAQILAAPKPANQKQTWWVILTDITEKKRSESIFHARVQITEFAEKHLLDEMLQFALDKLCALSQSPIGFFHFVEPDGETLSLQAWSTKTIKEMRTAEGKGRHYDINQAGVWVDCVRERKPVIHNDYESLPHKHGLPPGHAPIIREEETLLRADDALYRAKAAGRNCAAIYGK